MPLPMYRGESWSHMQARATVRESPEPDPTPEPPAPRATKRKTAAKPQRKAAPAAVAPIVLRSGRLASTTFAAVMR